VPAHQSSAPLFPFGRYCVRRRAPGNLDRGAGAIGRRGRWLSDVDRRLFAERGQAAPHRRVGLSPTAYHDTRCGPHRNHGRSRRTREKNGRPEAVPKADLRHACLQLRARLVSRAAELCITFVAVDPACTSIRGAVHRQKPLTSRTRKTTRHDAASSRSGDAPSGTAFGGGWHRPTMTRATIVGIGPSRPDSRPTGVREPAPRTPGPHTGCVPPDAERTRATGTPKTVRGVHSVQVWAQDSLLLTD